MKILFYDLETTGLKPNQHSIHQLSAIVEIDGVVKEIIDLKMRPHPKAKIEKQALDKGGVTEEQILAYPDPLLQFRRFKSILQKYVDPFDKEDHFYRCGFNNRQFDDNFLLTWFNLCGDNSHFCYFWPESWDVMIFASYYLKDIRTSMPSFQLQRVAKTLGIKVEDEGLHNAIYDVDLTRKVFYIVAPEPDLK